MKPAQHTQKEEHGYLSLVILSPYVLTKWFTYLILKI